MAISSDSRIREKLDEFSKRARHPITLEYLLEGWRKTVNAVEDGYEKSIYEYQNDLGQRDLLEDLIGVATADEERKLRAILRPLDERFLTATEEATRALGREDKLDERPWWNRIPRRRGQELLEDLRSEGFVD